MMRCMKTSKTKLTEKVVEEQTAGKISFPARLRGYFLAGIVVTAPISITVYVTYVFLKFVDSNVIKVLPDDWYGNFSSDTAIPGLGILIVLCFFIFVGWFAKNIMGRFFIRLSEYFVDRVPVIRTVYGAIKQIFETVMASQSQAFRDVVMLEYPRSGVWSIGFVTGTSKGEVQRRVSSDTINVFVPTTPNPTSGYLLFVPKKELIFLDMSVEEGVKLVVSAGIITPPDPHAVKKKAPSSAAKKTTAKKAVTAQTKKALPKPKVKPKEAPKKKAAAKKKPAGKTKKTSS